MEGPATPFPRRPTEAAAARRDKLLPPRRCPHRTWAAPLEKWRRPLGLLQLLPRLDVRRKVYPTPLEPGCSALAPLPSPSFGAAGAQFLRLRRAPLPSRVQRAPGAGVAALLPGCGFRERCSPRGRGAPEGRRPPPETKVPGLGFPSSPHPQAFGAGWRPHTARMEKLGISGEARNGTGAHPRWQSRLSRIDSSSGSVCLKECRTGFSPRF